MAYGRKYTPRKTSTPRTPRTPRGKYTPRKNYSKKMPMVSFAQKVNKIIARNVENKMTTSYTTTATVCTKATTGLPQWFLVKDWNVKLFTIAQGAAEQQRIGNQIKLKRWVIKGIIEPVISETRQFTYSNVGYVDVYFGKLMKNTAPPSNALTDLYQNGATATTPMCKSSDMLNPLNKDNYKVYYHRRFKMGYASDYNTYNAASGSNEHPANNDFKVSQTFGFDVCKYILKNKSLKYPDISPTSPPATYYPPDNADVVNLTVWATWTPLTSNSVGASTSSKSLYNINCLTYAEYEDA